MDLTEEVTKLIGNPESETLEYKAVLPPSKNISQLIAAFANKNGGFIVLGVVQTTTGLDINGLSADFNANMILHKAMDLLTPKPIVNYQYVYFKDKRLYVIKVENSTEKISTEGKIFTRVGDKIILENPTIKDTKSESNSEIKVLDSKLEILKRTGSGSKNKFIEHYQSVLNILDDLQAIVYPISPSIPTNNQEGKILMRILFSSCADNFETYLSDLLFEIYLANPSSLKSSQEVTIKEVLDCNDIQEFIQYWAKKKLSKLQRGSVKGFIKENSQIADLNVINVNEQKEIEKILQIRHLYAHRNGIVDEKFSQLYPGEYQLNVEHRLSLNEILLVLTYLCDTIERIDNAAILKYNLATVN